MTAAAPQYIPPQQPGQQQPQQSSGCLKWTLIGCSVVIVLALAGISVVVFGAMQLMKKSDAYKTARDRAISDQRVTAALGAPIETGWWVKGSLGDKGASIDFPISGPKNKAIVTAVATINDQGKWVYTRLEVRPDGGPPIDLLQ